MPKCIVHVGMHETGTSSIQHSLKTLDNESYCYAQVGGSPNHSACIVSIFAANSRKHSHRADAATAEEVDAAAIASRWALKKTMAEAGNRTLIISGEGILYLQEDEQRRLNAFLTRHGYETEVVAYIRDPVAYMSSAFQHKVVGGKLQVFSVDSVYPNYRKKFGRLDAAFGRENVTLWKFATANFPVGDVVMDFCGRFHIPNKIIKSVRKNGRPSRLATSLLYQLIQYQRQRGETGFGHLEGQELSAALSRVTDMRFRLSPSLLRPILTQNADDIKWMEGRLGEALDSNPGDEQPGDIINEMDLLNPVQNAEPILREILSDLGVSTTDSHGNIFKMMTAILKRAGQRDDGNRNAASGHDGNLVLPANGHRFASPRHAARMDELIEKSPVPDVSAAAPVNESARFIPVAVMEVSSEAARMQATRTESVDAEGLIPKPAMREPAAPLMRKYSADASKPKPVLPPIPATRAPIPLINKEKRLIVVWSPKSACTTTYVWFSHLSGFSNDVRRYAAWPHRHRIEQFQRSSFFAESANSDLSEFFMLRIIRDPYSRAVSIYRHALQTHFADAPMHTYSNGKISAEKGYSFQTFLDFAAQLDMKRVDIHFRPQLHPYEAHRKPDQIINISKQDLLSEIAAFETAAGLPVTNFNDLNWLHDLESKRKAKQEPMEGEELDAIGFTRHQVFKLGQFPSYGQLLTAKAKKKIESIYKADFEAYAEYL